ncbi:hypothetical protein EV360DRAFT_86082 [Lentinula raphanica]|nr:hypothetical protein EV360DRAFT_86082 [Lentinula raphanica]
MLVVGRNGNQNPCRRWPYKRLAPRRLRSVARSEPDPELDPSLPPEPELSQDLDTGVTPESSRAPSIPEEDTPSSTPKPFPTSSDPNDSSSDDEFYQMSSRTNATGRVDLGNGKHFGPKVVDRKGFNVFDLADLKEAIEEHAKVNKATEPSDLKALWRKAWSDQKELLWFRTYKDEHDALSMNEFLGLIRSRFLGANWPSQIAETRQRLRMKNTGAGAFDEFVSELQALNNELVGTNYHYDEKQLLAVISEGLHQQNYSIPGDPRDTPQILSSLRISEGAKFSLSTLKSDFADVLHSFRDDLIEADLDITPTTVLKTWKEKVDQWERRSAKWKNPPKRTESFQSNESSSSRYNPKRGASTSSAYTAPISVEEIKNLTMKSKFSKSSFLPRPLTDNDRALLALIEACFKCRTASLPPH